MYFFCLAFISGVAQENVNIYRRVSSNTSFPDSGRANGHLYNNVLYKASDHYADSSVLIIAPKKLDTGKEVDLIFWFHGWGNNIDSALKRYELLKQFSVSAENAVFVLSETAKDAPDSYGGKLEREGVFKNLVNDVLDKLKKEKIISKKCKPGNILLAGHSGAYRVMAYILENGKLRINEVILFDALYAETDKFLSWIQSDSNTRFINMYTDSGGTYDETKKMIQRLNELHLKTDTLEEKNVTLQLLQEEKIIFIHSSRAHNDIINNPDNFQLFIESNPFIKKIAK